MAIILLKQVRSTSATFSHALSEQVTYKYISSQAAISYLQESKLGLPRAMLAGDTTHSWLTYFPVKSAIEILESFESEGIFSLDNYAT